jgi:hypothetical protein
MSYPTIFSTPGVRAFAEAVDAERQRQLRKFGEQHHPDGTGLPVYEHSARRYRDHADRAAASGHLAWRDVLMEEVHEALAESDPAQLRAELVQVAAVCAAWITDLDSRGADETQPADDPLCICMHPRSRHPKISGRLLCDDCDPDSTDNLVCEEYTAL